MKTEHQDRCNGAKAWFTFVNFLLETGKGALFIDVGFFLELNVSESIELVRRDSKQGIAKWCMRQSEWGDQRQVRIIERAQRAVRPNTLNKVV